MLKTDWLKIGVEGPTIDRRMVQRDWLESAAALYAPSTYTATINSEHFFHPGLGWVAEVKAEPDEQGRMALWAKLVPTPDFLARNQSYRQLFFSMELTHGFPAEGDTYLSGLAITDVPASQGLEPQLFKAEKSPADGRKSERLLNTGGLELTEQGVWTSASKMRSPEQKTPAQPEAEAMPNWASRFLASISALLRGGAISTEQEEPMTKEELARIEALEAAMKQQGEALKGIASAVEKLTAEPKAEAKSDGKGDDKQTDPKAEPEKLAATDQAVADAVLAKVGEVLKPITDKLGEIDGFMNEVKATEALTVNGQGSQGDDKTSWV
jgi:hypothetical protein